MFYTYVLKSKENREQYVGYTNDLRRRLIEHNQGLNASTKRYVPWECIYYEACNNEEDAKRRERYLKTSQGSRFIRMRLREDLYGKSRSI